MIINRWQDNFADYKKLINHNVHEIIYITNAEGAKYIQNYEVKCTEHLVVDSLSDKKILCAIFQDLLNKYQCIDRVVAMSEMDIAIAGYLRSKYKISGMSEQTALNFTDKVCMKNALSGKGILFPKYTSNINKIDELTFPIILKPRNGASSEGVVKLSDYSEYYDYCQENILENYEAEEYIDGSIYHVDGFCFQGKLGFAKASEYINTPYDYIRGKTIGSIFCADNVFSDRVFSFTEVVLSALGLQDSVFHLEFIEHGDEFYFLEVGARQGGGEIVPMYKKLYNMDLIKLSFNLQIGVEKVPLFEKKDERVAAFLLFPEPSQLPDKVKEITMFNLESQVYQISPKIGENMEEGGGYYFNSGRFLFYGDSKQVIKDVNYVMSNFRITMSREKNNEIDDN
ncbi:hypothetical protein CAC02_07080 [Streptococcus gallolyticus]|uniref:ATP-grasp domain-containing protein n=1 Tax=Streptococcus gallolyticus TaxID=315405 RepID=A0A368UCK4_9STRE|nr:ATP-grasp domain-containing protein [Streptococcus gallolyticus]RCW16691.1 hypothetical protein CAC02_07080 [Streptococcus gallolyticus]